MARDNQVQAVYKSEDQAFDKRKEPEFISLDECSEFANQIINSEYWKKQKGLSRFDLHDGRGRRSACSKGRKKRGKGADVYCLPRWSRSKWIIIHEFSHGLTDRTCKGTAWHGAVFFGHYLNLLNEIIGEDASELLISKFKENGVKYLLNL